MGKASCAPKCLVFSNLLLSFLVFMPSFTHSASTALKKVIITCRYSSPCDHDFNCSWKLPEKINGIDVKVLVQQRNNNVCLKWKPCDGCNITTQRNNVLAEQGFIHFKLSHAFNYDDEYLVSVTVQDDDGNATTSIITSIKDVQPNSPTDVIVSPVMDKDTYLSVRWNNSSTNCLHLMYKLRYKQDQNEWEEIQIETDDEHSSCNIVDAHPGKKHFVQVAAKDYFQGSWSEWSSVAYGWPWSPVEVTTTEVIPRCQMHVTASTLMGKENGLKVQWDVTQTCPRPLVYMLWYRQYDQIEWKKYKTKDTFFNIMDIRPGVKYLVQVAAMGIDHKILSNWTSVTYKHSSSTTAGETIPWMVILIAIVVTLVSILTLLAVWHKWLRHEYSAITRKCSA